MKKLTAGIFTVLVSLVSANGANAAIATQGYVDQEVGNLSSTVSTLTQTVADNKLEAAAATKAVEDDLALYKTQADSTFMDAGEVDSKIESAVTGTDGILKNYSTTTQMNEAIATAKSGAEETAQGYVNALDLGSVGADGSYIKLVSQADGKLSATAEPFIDKKEGIVTGAKNAPSAGAVFDYVGEKISEVDGNAGAAMSAAETAQNTADAAQDAAEAAQETADGAVDVNTQQQTAIAKNASDLAEYKTTNDAAVKAADDKAVAAQGEVDALEILVGNNKSATDAAIENITKENGIIDTKVKASADVLEGKIAAANTAAGNAETNAKTYALEKANAALTEAVDYTDTVIANMNLSDISRVPADCADTTNYCSLTTNGTNFIWEVIKRADGETVKGTPVRLTEAAVTTKPEALK